MHLLEKFRQSAVSFPTEREKIGYIRDRTRDIAFATVKTRGAPDATDPYVDSSEMIADIDAMFGVFDKVAKASATLYDPSFPMGVKDSKETFETFYTRFSATIAPLNLPEDLRKMNLTQMISTRLKTRTAGQTFNTYRDLVNYVRKLDLDLRAVDAVKASNNSDKKDSKKGSGSNNSNSSRPQNSRTNTGMNAFSRKYNFPKHVTDKIASKGLCFKCLKKGHRAGNSDAPCKNDEYMSKEQVELHLKVAGVEVSSNTASTDNRPELPAGTSSSGNA